mmetsp:Transcript_21313/g.59236  ORF Transcript_21313/g.59236 Transcript_21313/m.59236 type:complete len:247 (+) Transcript_21313:1809-2549(+)
MHVAVTAGILHDHVLDEASFEREAEPSGQLGAVSIIDIYRHLDAPVPMCEQPVEQQEACLELFLRFPKVWMQHRRFHLDGQVAWTVVFEDDGADDPVGQILPNAEGRFVRQTLEESGLRHRLRAFEWPILHETPYLVCVVRFGLMEDASASSREDVLQMILDIEPLETDGLPNDCLWRAFEHLIEHIIRLVRIACQGFVHARVRSSVAGICRIAASGKGARVCLEPGLGTACQNSSSWFILALSVG